MSEPNIPGFDPNDDVGVETARPELKKPPMYKVIMLNDDFTPMEFVVHVLELFFNKDQEQATQIMLTVHTKGAAVCGIYPKDIAETKAEHVIEYAKDNQHPLMCQVDIAGDE
jgi:ATP-dependent Clp protease adaptor protein ClpS